MAAMGEPSTSSRKSLTRTPLDAAGPCSPRRSSARSELAPSSKALGQSSKKKRSGANSSVVEQRASAVDLHPRCKLVADATSRQDARARESEKERAAESRKQKAESRKQKAGTLHQRSLHLSAKEGEKRRP
eukprot:2280303-Rhodomonas_salina.1